MTQIHFPKFPKKNNFVSAKSVFLELIGTINTVGLGPPGIGLVVVGLDETLFYDSKLGFPAALVGKEVGT